MERSFILVTVLASGAMFAGVWAATAPATVSDAAAPPIMAGSADDQALGTVGETSGPVAARASDRRPVLRRPSASSRADAAPYNVVRSAYGSATPASRAATRSKSSVFYSGCREARAAGAAPIYRGQPGYRVGMDGDNDGIACEPYRG